VILCHHPLSINLFAELFSSISYLPTYIKSACSVGLTEKFSKRISYPIVLKLHNNIANASIVCSRRGSKTLAAVIVRWIDEYVQILFCLN
jgi:hypothetical protein